MHRLRLTLSLLAALAAAVASCSPGGHGGVAFGRESSFRLVGASVTAPTGGALPAEQQALADRLLGGRWSTFGLGWNSLQNDGQLELTEGSFQSSQTPAEPADWAADIPQPDGTAGSIALQGGDAVWTTQVSDAGDGFTGVTLVGRIDTGEALERVTGLLAQQHLMGEQNFFRDNDPLLIRWTITGLYNGLPFTAEVEQDYYVESYSTGISVPV